MRATYWISGLIILLATGCTSMKESADQVLHNAQSVYRSGKEKMWITPAGSKGAPVEAGAGQVLENAGSIVRSTSEKIWIPIEDVQEQEAIPVAENTYTEDIAPEVRY